MAPVVRLFRLLSVVVIVAMLFAVAAPVAQADEMPLRPVPVVGPRLSPPPIPHSSVLSPTLIYNHQPKPAQLAEATAVYDAQPVYKKGAGVLPTVTEHSSGLTLFATPQVCNSFDASTHWASMGKPPASDIWTDWFAGWAPFAVDNEFYQAKNTTFSVERSVGPGANYGKGYSAKIASNQPYAGGFGSPIIKVPAGAEVTVTVKYLIWDYVQAKTGGDAIKDWASMGVKADARADGARYVNGYVRGEWAEMTNTITAGASGEIMVLIQGESTGAVNSNIYFDDIQIKVGDEYLGECMFE